MLSPDSDTFARIREWAEEAIQDAGHSDFFALELSNIFGLLSRVIFGSNRGTPFLAFSDNCIFSS